MVVYVNGVHVGSTTSWNISTSGFGTLNAYIGRSQFSSDPYLHGYLRDFRCYRSGLR